MGVLKPKKTCCRSSPRCKRCPVVLMRLEAQGLAVRTGKGYKLAKGLTKKRMRKARR